MNGTQLKDRLGLTLTTDRKEAIQKTIMAMTLGKDVSALFPDVLKNIATADLDQKKLVYLYLMLGLLLRVCFRLTLTGIMPNPTPIFAFSPSTPSYKIRKTQTL
jgi:Adaptin N terminal region